MPRFTATPEARGAGRLVEVPLDVRELFGQARAPVRATVNEHTFRSRRSPSMTASTTSGSNREVRDAAGVEVGDVVTIDLERDEDERTVEVPHDLGAARDTPG